MRVCISRYCSSAILPPLRASIWIELVELPHRSVLLVVFEQLRPMRLLFRLHMNGGSGSGSSPTRGGAQSPKCGFGALNVGKRSSTYPSAA